MWISDAHSHVGEIYLQKNKNNQKSDYVDGFCLQG